MGGNVSCVFQPSKTVENALHYFLIKKQFALGQVLGFLCAVFIIFSTNRFRHFGNFSTKQRLMGL